MIYVNFISTTYLKDNSPIIANVSDDELVPFKAEAEKIDFKINDYSDVISILQSVQTPIGKETFTGDKKFSLGNTTLVASSRDVSIPLTIA